MLSLITGIVASLASYFAIPMAIVMGLGTFWAALQRSFSRALAEELVTPRTKWALRHMTGRNGGRKAEWVISLANLSQGQRVLDLGGGVLFFPFGFTFNCPPTNICVLGQMVCKRHWESGSSNCRAHQAQRTFGSRGFVLCCAGYMRRGTSQCHRRSARKPSRQACRRKNAL